MNADDLRLWKYTEEMATRHGFMIDTKGDKFYLYCEERQLGLFEDARGLYLFLCGYEWGKNE